MAKTVIYPGTFDPITNGHIDLVKRSLTLFDEIIVAVAEDTKKSTLFPWQERINLAKEVLRGFDRVEVCGFSGFLVKFSKERGASAIVRGLRVISDFEYEFQLAGINRQLAPDLETVFLTPSARYTYISSSMVREIAELGGDVSPFVPKIVAEALQKLQR